MSLRMDEKLSKVDPKLLDLLVCPAHQRRLAYDREHHELISESAKLAYPIRGRRAVMLISEAARSRTDASCPQARRQMTHAVVLLVLAAYTHGPFLHYFGFGYPPDT